MSQRRSRVVGVPHTRSPRCLSAAWQCTTQKPAVRTRVAVARASGVGRCEKAGTAVGMGEIVRCCARRRSVVAASFLVHNESSVRSETTNAMRTP